jgi:PKD repeat protein
LLAAGTFAQGWVYVSGLVTNIDSDLPVINHPVVILSDSSGGFIYYNVVYTDSTGAYYDGVPVLSDSTGILFVQTHDCNFELHSAALFYSPVNTQLTHDFAICTGSNICQALFSFYSEPPGSINSFQFIDQSIGYITSWLWSFGDGNVSGEQNPSHTFNSLGTFEVCLTISGLDCSDMYCFTIVISDTLYEQIYGQVFMGNFPLQTGEVALYAMNQQGAYEQFGDRFPVDSNGIFYFTTVPQGQYLLQAFPFGSTSYVPTYYGDVISWQNALVINVPELENPCNINLSKANEVGITGGQGSIMGQVNAGRFSRASLHDITMFILDESYVPYIYEGIDPSGSFEFQFLDYGTYLLKAELAGIYSDYIRIDITQEQPHHDITLSFDGNSILGTGDLLFENQAFTLFPNPVDDRLYLMMEGQVIESFRISLYSMKGELLYRDDCAGLGLGERLCIPFSDFPVGLYVIRAEAASGATWSRRIIKQ